MEWIEFSHFTRPEHGDFLLVELDNGEIHKDFWIGDNWKQNAGRVKYYCIVNKRNLDNTVSLDDFIKRLKP